MSKPRIALHLIMPNQVSGPNTSSRLIGDSHLADRFEFDFVVQSTLAGGRVSLRLIRDLRAQFRKIKPDLAHLSGLQASGFHAVVAARLAGCSNVLVTIHGFSSDAVALDPLKRFAFTRIIEPLTIRLSRYVLTVCEEAGRKPMVLSQRRKYLGVIHNPAPAIDFDIAEARSEFRRSIGAGDEDFLVVVVGRMVYDKGISFISEAMAQLGNPSIKFVFVGDGVYTEALAQAHTQSIADGRLFLLGKRDDVKRILPGCDLFLFATLHENLSNALLEAMAVGLPVVATAVGGNVEVVEDEGNGLLVPPCDSVALAEAVERVWQDTALRRNMSARSREIVQDKFSQATIYGQLEAVYSMMLDSGGQ